MNWNVRIGLTWQDESLAFQQFIDAAKMEVDALVSPFHLWKRFFYGRNRSGIRLHLKTFRRHPSNLQLSTHLSIHSPLVSSNGISAQKICYAACLSPSVQAPYQVHKISPDPLSCNNHNTCPISPRLKRIANFRHGRNQSFYRSSNAVPVLYSASTVSASVMITIGSLVYIRQDFSLYGLYKQEKSIKAYSKCPAIGFYRSHV